MNDQRCPIITTMRLVPLLVDSTMNMNEEMNAAFTANPKKFLNADTFCFVEPQACGPPLSVVQLDESVKSRSTYVAARMVHRLFLVLAREPKRTRLIPTVLDLRPGILPLSNLHQPPLHCARTVERPPAGNFRTQI